MFGGDQRRSAESTARPREADGDEGPSHRRRRDRRTDDRPHTWAPRREDDASANNTTHRSLRNQRDSCQVSRGHARQKWQRRNGSQRQVDGGNMKRSMCAACGRPRPMRLDTASDDGLSSDVRPQAFRAVAAQHRAKSHRSRAFGRHAASHMGCGLHQEHRRRGHTFEHSCPCSEPRLVLAIRGNYRLVGHPSDRRIRGDPYPLVGTGPHALPQPNLTLPAGVRHGRLGV